MYSSDDKYLAMEDGHIWTLIARKLTGEATVGEMGELQELLKENPEIHYSLEVFDQLWTEIPYGGHWPVAAYARLVENLEKQGIEFPPGDRKALYEKEKEKLQVAPRAKKTKWDSLKSTWRNLFRHK